MEPLMVAMQRFWSTAKCWGWIQWQRRTCSTLPGRGSRLHCQKTGSQCEEKTRCVGVAHVGVGGADLVQTIVIQQSGAVSLVPRLLRRKIVLKLNYYMACVA